MNFHNQNRVHIAENIPVNLPLFVRAKEKVHTVFRSRAVIWICAHLPTIGPLKKPQKLAQRIGQIRKLFQDREAPQTSIFGGDKLSTLENEIKTCKTTCHWNYGATKITVENESCTEVAKRIFQNEQNSEEEITSIVGIHNLANRVQVGGTAFDPYGGSQEEYLMRNSNLYWSLDPKNFEFETAFKKMRKKELFNDQEKLPKHHLPYFGGVISKGVQFVDEEGQNSFSCDVVSTAAPDLRWWTDEGKYLKKHYSNEQERKAAVEWIIRQKARAVLGAFLQSDTKHIVLGAAGCGVFKNDPEVVAKVFAEELKGDFKDCFASVTFAIKEGKEERLNNIFKKHLCPGSKDS